MKHLIFFLVLFSWTINAQDTAPSQNISSIEDFIKHINDFSPNQTIVIGDSMSIEETITYLGRYISDEGKKLQFVTVFRRVKAAIVHHGKSLFFIIDNEGYKAFNVGMPYNLPTKLIGKEFYYLIDGKNYASELEYYYEPELICLPPKGCYERSLSI